MFPAIEMQSSVGKLKKKLAKLSKPKNVVDVLHLSQAKK